MTDIVDRQTRSRMMSGIGSRNTRPEAIVASLVHREGLRFRKNVASLPGKPDLVFARYRKCLLVNGCFWHGHECRNFAWPKTNRKFWREKILGNVERDAKNLINLRRLGWRCRVVWECDVRRLKDPDRAKRFAERMSAWIRTQQR
jgi:DNA mismatch endonuclease (patch repair protein)